MEKRVMPPFIYTDVEVRDFLIGFAAEIRANPWRASSALFADRNHIERSKFARWCARIQMVSAFDLVPDPDQREIKNWLIDKYKVDAIKRFLDLRGELSMREFERQNSIEQSNLNRILTGVIKVANPAGGPNINIRGRLNSHYQQLLDARRSRPQHSVAETSAPSQSQRAPSAVPVPLPATPAPPSNPQTRPPLSMNALATARRYLVAAARAAAGELLTSKEEWKKEWVKEWAEATTIAAKRLPDNAPAQERVHKHYSEWNDPLNEKILVKKFVHKGADRNLDALIEKYETLRASGAFGNESEPLEFTDLRSTAPGPSSNVNASLQTTASYSSTAATLTSRPRRCSGLRCSVQVQDGSKVVVGRARL
ncbi:hypothetical protein F8271_31290 [Micromonospora sp. ALFpr18c]|uniref:hypothetical protein n=1 Tax=Micromonospora sp. ALFpr18c TaxID=1458665 RepID=UPI00124BA33F|nr:hypothetical protein [Micromonospora sp. ALFpr18c]KAB1922238.1 hypothetical protein F8271_31290 [Micromonospora sp. ALFpr18c]